MDAIAFTCSSLTPKHDSPIDLKWAEMGGNGTDSPVFLPLLFSRRPPFNPHSTRMFYNDPNGRTPIPQRRPNLPVSKDTLKAIIEEYGGIPLSDEELDLVAPEVESYLKEANQLRELDLSSVMSGRLMRAQEATQDTEEGANG